MLCKQHSQSARPGAASLVVSKNAGSLDLTNTLEVVDFATGTTHVLSYSSVQTNPGVHFIDAVRWDGSGSPLRLLESNTGLVRLYERFMKTGSERLANLLAGHGVLARRSFLQ